MLVLQHCIDIVEKYLKILRFSIPKCNPTEKEKKKVRAVACDQFNKMYHKICISLSNIGRLLDVDMLGDQQLK